MVKKGILITLIAIMMAGCAALRDFAENQRPTIQYSSMSIQSIDFSSATIQFNFDVNNPNPVGLTASRYSYEFFVNENSFLSGTQDENLRISRESVSTLSVPVTLRFSEMFNTFSTLFRDDSFAYAINTEVQFDVPGLGMQRLPVNASGTLPIPKVPRFEFGGFDVKNLTLSGAEMELSLNITNSNSFPIALNRANYQLEVNGRNWLDTSLNEPLRLGESESSQIIIPISLNASQMGNVLVEMMRGTTNFEYKLSGSADVGAEIEGFSFTDTIPFDMSGVFRN